MLLGLCAGCGADRNSTPRNEQAPGAPTAPRTVELTVSAEGLRNEQGIVLCTVFTGPEGFPSNATASDRRARVELPAPDDVRFTFRDLEPGFVAVAVVHDENANGKLDRGFLGKPTEGYGVSNNPPRGFSAPSYESARVDIQRGEQSLSVRIEY
jgi:uncharacterized protein (DUF2141 family)